MPRIRTIKPEFFRHEGLQDLEKEHPELHPMLVFAGLWTVADKNGTFLWKPRSLKLDILPFLDFDLSASLELLREAGEIDRFVSDDDQKEYGQVLGFVTHQRISGKEAIEPPRFPVNPQGNNREASEQHPVAQERKGKGKERNGLVPGKQFPVPEPEPDLEAYVLKIGHLYPGNSHLKGRALPNVQQYAIAEAIAQDGDAVLEGTEAYAAEVAKWPESEHIYIPKAERFYAGKMYLMEPHRWRKNVKGEAAPLPKSKGPSGVEIAYLRRAEDLLDLPEDQREELLSYESESLQKKLRHFMARVLSEREAASKPAVS